MSKSRGIYLHVPYCVAKCAYCDFFSMPLGAESELEHYLAALQTEIRLRASGRAETVYLGGGTPSLCAPEQIQALLSALAERALLAPDAEITLETNPATADREKLAGFRRAGVNRLSVGIQSTSDPRLRLLGRVHTAAQAEQLLRDARAAGFGNISCDLIYGLPDQNVEEFRQDLATLVAWEPDHLSLYALSVEPGTRLAARIAGQEISAPNEDQAADMYEWAQDFLFSKGFFQYELSNFARPGHSCRHNLIYWTDGAYLGLGVAAHSYERGVRSWNTREISTYFLALAKGARPCEGAEKLKSDRKIAEELILGLRLTAGVPEARFRRRHGPGWKQPFREAIQDLVRDGLLLEEAATLRLTRRGMLLANVVFRALV